jgi:hypothetical protein
MEMLKMASGWSPQLGLSSYSLLQESAILLIKVSIQFSFKFLGYNVSGTPVMQALDDVEAALAWLRLKELTLEDEDEAGVPLTHLQHTYLQWCHGFHQFIEQSLSITSEEVLCVFREESSQNKAARLYHVWNEAMKWGGLFHQHIHLLRSSYLEVLSEGVTPSQNRLISTKLVKLCEKSLEAIVDQLQGTLAPLSTHRELRCVSGLTS